MNDPRFKIRCPKCNVGLKATEASIGKRKKCPNCQTEFEVRKSKVRDTDEIPLPATEKQKNHARSLGIAFPLYISAEEMDTLINEAIKKRSGNLA